MLIMNEMAVERLCEALQEAHGIMPKACKMLGVKIRDVERWIARDPEVASRVREAQMIGYSAIEEEIRRRAIEGVEVPVFQKGELAGYRTEYSDSLLALMAKSRVPGYAQQDGSSGRAVTVNVAVMPRASNYDEWVIQRDKELEKLKPEPLMIEEATYEDVPVSTNCLKDVL